MCLRTIYHCWHLEYIILQFYRNYSQLKSVFWGREYRGLIIWLRKTEQAVTVTWLITTYSFFCIKKQQQKKTFTVSTPANKSSVTLPYTSLVSISMFVRRYVRYSPSTSCLLSKRCCMSSIFLSINFVAKIEVQKWRWTHHSYKIKVDTVYFSFER